MHNVYVENIRAVFFFLAVLCTLEKRLGLSFVICLRDALSYYYKATGFICLGESVV